MSEYTEHKEIILEIIPLAQKILLEIARGNINPVFGMQERLGLLKNHMPLLKQSAKTIFSINFKKILDNNHNINISKDSRFNHQLWQDNKTSHKFAEIFLNLEAQIQNNINTISNLTNHEKKSLTVYFNIILEAMAPSNFAFANPEIVQLTKDSKGLNLLKGLKHYLQDLYYWHGYANVTKASLETFEIGKHIATTPGDVIYENTVMQLIQYKPTTDSVYETPILSVGSWINKYYINDLSPQNSKIAWLVNQGYTVFAISWINPGYLQGHYGFFDFVEKGLMRAIDFVLVRCQVEQLSLHATCLGGTMAAAALAIYAKENTKPVKNILLSASLIDFKYAGNMRYFSGDEQFAWTEKVLQDQKIWPGRRMLSLFNYRHPDIYIWPFFIRHYLRGKSPGKFDVLFWSQDITNISGPLFLFHIKELLTHNYFAQEFTYQNKVYSINDINIPVYNVCFEEDDLSPWRASYESMHHFKSTKPIFVLASGSHVSGLLSHPKYKRLSYYRDDNLNIIDNPDIKHLKNTDHHHQGTWWEDYLNWQQGFCNKMIAPRVVCETDSIEAAPGRFAKKTVFKKIKA